MVSSRDEEPRRRRKDYDRERDPASISTSTSRDKDRDRDRDRDRDKDKDKDRRRSPKKIHRKRSEVEPDRAAGRDPTLRLERSSIPDLQLRPGKKVTMVVPEMDRRSSTGETRVASYPSFSKAHSRESTGPDNSKTKTAVLTPDPTDVSPKRRSHDAARPRTATSTSTSDAAAARLPSRAPPSPPLTADDPDLNRVSSRSNSKRASERVMNEAVGGRRSMDSTLRASHHSRNSDSGSIRRKPSSVSPDSLETSESDGSTSSSGSRSRSHSGSGPSTAVHETRSAPATDQKPMAARIPSTGSNHSSQITADSQATSRAGDWNKGHAHPPTRAAHGEAEALDGSWRAPTLNNEPMRSGNSHHRPTPIEVGGGGGVATAQYQQANSTPKSAASNSQTAAFSPQSTAFSAQTTAFSAQSLSAGMPPPPPPPPVLRLQDAPRVDYLLQNGGLVHPIARSFIPPVGSLRSVQANDKRYCAPFPISTGHSMNDLTDIFGSLGSRVDDLWTVLSKDGSIAAATGYRPVARKMLDRLQSVFCRDLTNEKCHCVVCRNVPRLTYEFSGYNWGEMLELAAGRQTLPQWPPFTITAADAPGLGISEAPMQKLDPDVPEEYREHYMRQNARTKRVVQDWLQRHTEVPSSPPADVDNDTLTFAMLTHLDPERRQLFTALMRGMSVTVSSRTPTPANESKNDVLAKAALAIQRAYRLSIPPREPETAMYLLNNPTQHDMLATVAAVTEGEWDILTSGRFDGFLWGGGEALAPAPGPGYPARAPSRGPTTTPLTPFSTGAPSRGTTPFSPLRNVMSPDQLGNPPPSRGSTPAPGSTGAVQYDEEMEITVAGEVEQELFRAMEMLEDHLEQVHGRAQAVLDALRLRSSGLIAAARARKGSLASEVDVRMGTPASVFEEGSYLDDAASELAPDDSASNIGFSKRRRARRHERRTPAPVEEENESDVDAASTVGIPTTKYRRKSSDRS
ncbi:hypothetical protein MBLNU459_g0204t1 [Dothideomycetes sp. NU459]